MTQKRLDTEIIADLKKCTIGGVSDRVELEALLYETVLTDAAREYYINGTDADYCEVEWEVPWEELRQGGLRVLADDELKMLAKDPSVLVVLAKNVRDEFLNWSTNELWRQNAIRVHDCD